MDKNQSKIQGMSIDLINFSNHLVQYAKTNGAKTQQMFKALSSSYSYSMDKLPKMQNMVSEMIASDSFESFCRSSDGLNAIFNIFLASSSSDDEFPKEVFESLDQLIELMAKHIPGDVYGIQFDGHGRTGNTLLRQLCVYVKFGVERDKFIPNVLINVLNKVDFNIFSVPIGEKYLTGNTPLLNICFSLSYQPKNELLFLLMNALILKLPEEAWYQKVSLAKGVTQCPEEEFTDFSLNSSPFSELCDFIYRFSNRHGFFDVEKKGILFSRLLERTPVSEFVTIVGKNVTSPLLDLCYALTSEKQSGALKGLCVLLQDKKVKKEDWLHIYKKGASPLLVLFLGLKSIKHSLDHPLLNFIKEAVKGIEPEEFSKPYAEYRKRKSKTKSRDVSMIGLLDEAITANPDFQRLKEIRDLLTTVEKRSCLGPS